MAKKVSKRREWTPAQVRTLKTLARQENARGENRQNTKANRRCDAAKGIHSRFVARTRGPEISTSKSQGCIVDSSSAMRGAFL